MKAARLPEKSTSKQPASKGGAASGINFNSIMQCSHHRLLITSQRLSFIHNTPSPLKALTWQDNLMSYIISSTSSSCHPIPSHPRWWLPFPNTPELHKFVGGNPRSCENNNYWLTISLLPPPAVESFSLARLY